MDYKVAVDFESKETAENLLPVLAESGQVVPAIKVIFDRDWSNDFSLILNTCAASKKTEIETICNDNYSDFIDAIDQLLGVQLSVQQLQTKIKKLNSEIQSNGGNLRVKISKLLVLKQTRRNMDITINKLNRLRYVLQLMEKIRDMIAKKKYISALKNLNQLTSHHLLQLQEYSITRKIWDGIPNYMDQIKKRVSTNFKEWVHNMNKESELLGALALKQTRQYIEKLEFQKTNKKDAPQDQESVALQMQLQEKFGVFLSFDGDQKTSNEHQRRQLLSASGSSVKKHDMDVSDEAETLFEKIENLDFNAVYQCIHIHETLGSLDEFVSTYHELRERRRNEILYKMPLINLSYHSSLSSLTSEITNQVTKQQTARADFKTEKIVNHAYFNSLCGFYVMEHSVMSRYQQLCNQELVQSHWDQSCKTLTKRITTEMLSKCKLPSELIDIKNELLLLAKAIAMNDFKVNHMTSFLEELRLEFEKTLVVMLEKNVKKILEKDKFTPFVVESADDYETIEAYNLNDIDMDELPELEFPLTVPFSVSVPMICSYLDDFMQYYDDYSKYLSDMSPHIRQAVQQAICNVVCKQLKHVITNKRDIGINDGTNGGGNNANSNSKMGLHRKGGSNNIEIAELAQLAVNAAYFEKSCTFFENELNNLSNYSDEQFFNNDDDDMDEYFQVPKMHKARDELKSVMSQCVDSLFELLANAVEEILLKYIPKINWMSDKQNNNINEWVYKLIEFLDDILKNKVKYLPEQYRDTAYYITMSSINNFIANVLTSNEYFKKFNIISVYNFNLDITRLETYCRSTQVSDLHQTFRKIRQTLDLLLSGSKEMVKYLDESTKMEKYPYVQAYELRAILEKYKTLGLLTKLPKYINNLDKKTCGNMIKSLKNRD